MPSKKRTVYSRDFKIEAVKLVTDQNYSIAEAADSLGVSASAMRAWVGKYQSEGQNAFPGRGKLPPDQEELRRLREENRRLKMDREILKKATAFFANQ